MILPILSVSDVDASLAFYKEKLGFEERMSMPGPDGITTFAGIALGKAQIMLSRAETEHKGQGVVFMVYVPEGTSIDTVYQEVKDRGVTIVEELKTEYWGDRIFTVHDPDGYNITMCEEVEPIDMEHVEKVMSGEVERG